jgi:hypothetical protein
MLRLKTRLPALLLCAAAFSFCSSAQANLVTNGGFETGDFTGWTQTGNTGFSGVTCPSGCFAFFGPVGSNGGISETLATTPGAQYTVSYSLNPDGGTPSFFSATFGAVTLQSLTNPAASPFTEFSFLVTATGASTILAFNFRDDPGFISFDNASVTTPLPAALPLFAGGLGVLGLLARRRKQKSAAVIAA